MRNSIYSLWFSGKTYIRQTAIMVIGDKMPKKWTVLVNDNLDERFRKTVFETKGMHKGNLTEAIEEAMNCWIKQQEKKKKP
jgi:hypothetical protein